MKPLVLFSVLCAPLAMRAAEAPTLTLKAERKGFASPESVASDGTHYYVSNVGKELKPMDKDGDGFISRMDANGDELDLHFIDGLNAPKGMLVSDGTLFVCDVDVLLGFDLATRKKTLELSFAKDGVQFLNDVCAAPDGRLFVSATDKNALYLADPKGKSAAPIQLDIAPKGPNGLATLDYDGATILVVAEWGDDDKPNGSLRGYKLDATFTKGTREANDEDFPVKSGFKDGLALVTADGKPVGFLHSDWVDFKSGGKVYLLCESGYHDLAIPKGPVGGPADLFYDSKASTLALPCMIDGRLLLLKLNLPQG
jgi:sugar lactone lactonase YvrE